MKLKCWHDRRVMVVGPLNTVYHRSDGSICQDLTPKLGLDCFVETREMGTLVMYNLSHNGRSRREIKQTL